MSSNGDIGGEKEVIKCLPAPFYTSHSTRPGIHEHNTDFSNTGTNGNMETRLAESCVVTYSRGSRKIREALPAHQFSHYRKAWEPEKSLESYEKKRGVRK